MWEQHQTEEADKVKQRDWLVPLGLVLCVSLSVVVTYFGLDLRDRLIASCEPFPGADRSPGEGWYVTFFLAPVLLIVSFVVLTLAYGVSAFAWGRKRPWIPVLVGVLAAAVVGYLFILWADVPGYTPICPTGRPEWWPRWLPL